MTNNNLGGKSPSHPSDVEALANDLRRQIENTMSNDTTTTDEPTATDDQENTKQMPSGDTLASGLLSSTADLVSDDRDTHGDAVENQRHIAEAWAWYLRGHGYLKSDVEITGGDVARMMQLVKLSRGAVGEYDVDHDRDVAGYAGIAAACEVFDGNAPLEEIHDE